MRSPGILDCLLPREQKYVLMFLNETAASPRTQFFSAEELWKHHRAELLLRVRGGEWRPKNSRVPRVHRGGIELLSSDDPIVHGRKSLRIVTGEAESEKNKAAWKSFESRKGHANEQLESSLKFWRECRSWSIGRLRAELSSRLWRCRTCGRLWLSQNGRRRTYCNLRVQGKRKSCGWKANAKAKAAVYRKRAEEKAEKLRRARAAIKRCPTGHRDWKAWVSFRADVSRNWLTYAVRRGELQAPKERMACRYPARRKVTR